MSSSRKLQEAAFFIELLHALEARGRALTHSDDAAMEASFLFAAILNSFYSTVVMVEEEEKIDARNFRARYPEIYAQGTKGGERGKTVHIAHVEAAHSGYIPPRGDNVRLRLRRPPRLVPEQKKEPGRADLVFRKMHYIDIELLDRKEHALSFCEEHFDALKEFHRESKGADRH